MAGSFRPAVREGFRLLARFIFGQNRALDGSGPQRIAMTRPVAAAPAQAERAAARTGWWVTFTMPASFRRETLPTPLDPRVEIRRRRGGLYAVARFAGVVTGPADWTDAEAAMRASLGTAGLTPAGPPVTAQYNGPWVPGPFRRNELLLPVTCAAPEDSRCERPTAP